jgi:hypothetical protein
MNPKLQQLIDETNGKYVTVTGPDQKQCTAIPHRWEQILGLPIVYGDAKDTFDNAPDTVYIKTRNIEDDLTNFPKPGAIVAWRPPWGGYTDEQGALRYAGHTGVAITADGNTAHVLEQNDGENGITHIGEHNYKDVIGWFYPKILDQGDNVSTDSLTKEEIEVINELTYNDAHATDDLVAAYEGKPLDGLLQQLQADPTRHAQVARYNSVDGLTARVIQLTEANTVLAKELNDKPSQPVNPAVPEPQTPPVSPEPQPELPAQPSVNNPSKVPFFSTTEGRFWLNVLGTGLGIATPYISSLPVNPAITGLIGMIAARLVSDISNKNIANTTTSGVK